MPTFVSKSGEWFPKDKAAKETLKEKKVKSIGRKSETSFERGYRVKK